MPRQLTLRLPGRTLLLVPNHEVSRLDAHAGMRLLHEAADEPHGHRVLRDLAHENGIFADDTITRIEALASRFDAGRLVLVRLQPEPVGALTPVGPAGEIFGAEDWETLIPLSELLPRGSGGASHEPLTPAASRRAPEPDAAQTWIELELVHENGCGLPGVQLELELSDGSSRVAMLDEQGRWRATDLPAGATARVTLATPASLPAFARRRALDGSYGLPLVDLVDGAATVITGRTQRIIVPRSKAYLGQLDAVHFGMARAIVLPNAPLGHATSPLASLASIVAFAATEGRDLRVVIAGHTDSSGNTASNLALSEARARNVELLLRNRKSEWAAHSLAHYAVEDLQHIYAWVSARQLWACDPGPADNDLGPRTVAARRAFRVACNHERATELQLDAEIDAADWEAIFDLYVEELGMMLSDLGDLATLTASMLFSEPAVVGCADHWPQAAVTLPGYTTGETRRVDAFFVPAYDLPDFGYPTPGYDLYATQRYCAQMIPQWPIETRTRVQLRDAQGTPRSNVEYELRGIAAAHIGTTDAHGFTEEFVAHPGDLAELQVGDLLYRIRVGAESAQGLTFAQSVLNSLGYYAGPTNGLLHRSTRSALRNFQWVTGLAITGDLDPDTERALRAAAWRA